MFFFTLLLKISCRIENQEKQLHVSIFTALAAYLDNSRILNALKLNKQSQSETKKRKKERERE